MITFPLSLQIMFAATTFLTLAFFYRSTTSFRIQTMVILCVWLLIQGMISLLGFYTNTEDFPPRMSFLLAPPLIVIIIGFASKKGRVYIDTFEPKFLTLLHIVRIPVELVLYSLYIRQAIPELMTFEGRNFDILSGLSAPVIYFFGYQKLKLSKALLIFWNVLCILLLLNIVINAILSVPTSFQQFGFEQPNVGILYFPFVWLPCFVVPAVLFSHLVCIRKLWQ